MNQLFKNRYKEREPGALLKAMTPQPSIEANPDTETHATQSEHIPEASQKSNIFGKLWDGMKSTFSETVIPPTDTSPATTKEGLGHKIMKYALPALTTMGGGAGALPGLLAGFASNAKNRRLEVEDRNKWSGQQAEREAETAKQQQQNRQFGQKLDIDKMNAESNRIRALKTKSDTLTPEEDKALNYLTQYDVETQKKIGAMSDNDLIMSEASATDPQEKAMFRAIRKQRKASKMYEGE